MIKKGWNCNPFLVYHYFKSFKWYVYLFVWFIPHISYAFCLYLKYNYHLILTFIMKKQISDSWDENAKEWIKVIEESSISSRKITNPAIIEAVLESGCTKILDAGCGEGWLCRALAKNGLILTGIDENEELLEYAAYKGLANYAKISFEEIIAEIPFPDESYECIIFNFSLYLEEETLQLLDRLKRVIPHHGKIILQTIHPFYLFQNNLTYTNQWIPDSWKGLNGSFHNGHPFFIRTFSGWMQTIEKAGLRIMKMKEPINESGIPVSLILILSPST